MNRHGLLSVMLIAVLTLGGCGEDKESVDTQVRPLLSIVVTPQTIQKLQFAGSVEPRIKAELGFRVLGRVIKREVGVGDMVTKGEVIAMLDPLVLELSVRSAEADLSNAEAQFINATQSERRQFQLSQVNSSTQADYENALLAKESAEASVAKAKANLAKATEELSYAELRAEFDGVIIAVSAEVGQVISAGETAFIQAQPDLRDVVIDVPEDAISSISHGALFNVSLQLDPSIHATGSVREIAPQSDETTRTHRVKISLSDPPRSFRLGTVVTASATTKKLPQIMLPRSAILEDAGSTSVWVVDPLSMRVSRRAVSIMKRETQPGTVTILEGLKQGERVAVAGVHSLQDDQLVRLDGSRSQ